MHRGPARLASVPAVALVLAAGATGCAANGGDESMLVLKNVAPGDKCTFTPAVTETGISHGALDTTIPTPYLFTAQVKSRVTAAAGQEDQRTILLTGANVDIVLPGAPLFSQAEIDMYSKLGLTKFKSPFSAPLTPNGGLLDVPFELVPAEVASLLVNKPGFVSGGLLAKFRLVGTFPGSDDELTSQEFQYPVTILKGGLVIDKGACAMLASSFAPRGGNSCNPGQDFVVDCCSDAAGDLQCPAVGTASAVNAQ